MSIFEVGSGTILFLVVAMSFDHEKLKKKDIKPGKKHVGRY